MAFRDLAILEYQNLCLGAKPASSPPSVDSLAGSLSTLLLVAKCVLTTLIMKLLTSLVWASAAVGVFSAAPEAYVYVSTTSGHPNTKVRTASPNEARLLFAQRLGLSNYYSLGEASDSFLELLNNYGSPQKQLLGEERPRNRLLAIVEGVETPEGISEDEGTLKEI